MRPGRRPEPRGDQLSRRPHHLARFRPPDLRSKRWEWWGVVTPRHIIGLTVADAHHVGLTTVHVLDRTTGEQTAIDVVTPLAAGITLQDRCGQGASTGGTRTLAARIDQPGPGLPTRLRLRGERVRLDVHVDGGERDSLGVVVPWSARRADLPPRAPARRPDERAGHRDHHPPGLRHLHRVGGRRRRAAPRRGRTGGVGRGGAQPVVPVVAVAAIAWVGSRLTKAGGPQLTSVVQCSVRLNTYIGLIFAAALQGNLGLATFALACAVVVPLVNLISVTALAVHGEEPEGVPRQRLWREIATNPFILACVLGVLINLVPVDVPQALRSTLEVLSDPALASGTLIAGSALRLHLRLRDVLDAAFASVLKLGLLPAAAMGRRCCWASKGRR